MIGNGSIFFQTLSVSTFILITISKKTINKPQIQVNKKILYF